MLPAVYLLWGRTLFLCTINIFDFIYLQEQASNDIFGVPIISNLPGNSDSC